MSNINVEKTQEEAAKAKLLPEPKGFRILCAVPHVEEEYEGGIIKAFPELNDKFIWKGRIQPEEHVIGV